MLFNLIDQPWLVARPVGGGRVAEYSLRQILMEAENLEDLVVDVPTQKPAILRQLLLPIVLHALDRVPDNRAWARLFHAGAFSPEQRKALNDYLDACRDLFDLFHPTDPFAQVADLHTARDETKGTALLVATEATGNNVPLFACRTEGDPLELTPAQAARWLLHTHCWDTAAIKTGVVGDSQVKAGKTTGNPTGPLGQFGVVMPVGRTLYETILLNLPSGGVQLSDDLPQWLRRSRDGRVEETQSVALPAWQARAAKGLLDLWTWQSRRIRLIPQETPVGIRVTRVIVAAGDRLSQTPDFEPHATWTLDPAGGTRGGRSASSRKTGKPAKQTALLPRRPRRHQPGKAAWRGLDALLATDREDTDATTTTAGFHTSLLLDQLRTRRETMPSDFPLQVELSGIVYGTQSAVVEDILFDAIPLPLTSLGADSLVHAVLLEITSQAEELAQAVNYLSADLRRAAGADPIPWDRGQRPGDMVLHAFDPLVRRLLVGLRAVGEDVDQIERGQLAWEQVAWQRTWEIAEQVFATAPPTTFAGRIDQKKNKEGSQEGKKAIYRMSTAEASFRRRINQILTRAAEARSTLKRPETKADAVPTNVV